MDLARARSGGFGEYISLPTVMLIVFACAAAALIEVATVTDWSGDAAHASASASDKRNEPIPSPETKIERTVPTHALCVAESDGKVLVAWKNGRHYCFRYGGGDLISAASPAG